MMNYQEWNSNSYSSISTNSTTLVDVSSFLLFESSGDSEFDSNCCSTTSDNHPMINLNPSHQRFLEDDDAQSCSYEDMELDFKIKNDNNDDDDDVDTYSRCSSDFNRKSVDWNRNIDDEDEDEDEDENDGGVVEQRWMNSGVNRCNEKLKSNVCSSVVVDCELKSQKDKDKLFWETCLAS